MILNDQMKKMYAATINIENLSKLESMMVTLCSELANFEEVTGRCLLLLDEADPGFATSEFEFIKDLETIQNLDLWLIAKLKGFTKPCQAKIVVRP